MFRYVEINNNSCIFSKMTAKMAIENLNLMLLVMDSIYTKANDS